MADFRIYYDDGSTHDDEIGSAPFMSVLLILEKDPAHGRRIVASNDFYIYRFDKSRWLPVDYNGLIQYLAEPGIEKRVLMGKMVLEEEWYAVLRRAKADPDFPQRSGYYKDEPRIK